MGICCCLPDPQTSRHQAGMITRTIPERRILAGLLEGRKLSATKQASTGNRDFFLFLVSI
jgi:hypothetical protein